MLLLLCYWMYLQFPCWLFQGHVWSSQQLSHGILHFCLASCFKFSRGCSENYSLLCWRYRYYCFSICVKNCLKCFVTFFTYFLSLPFLVLLAGGGVVSVYLVSLLNQTCWCYHPAATRIFSLQTGFFGLHSVLWGCAFLPFVCF